MDTMSRLAYYIGSKIAILAVVKILDNIALWVAHEAKRGRYVVVFENGAVIVKQCQFRFRIYVELIVGTLINGFQGTAKH